MALPRCRHNVSLRSAHLLVPEPYAPAFCSGRASSIAIILLGSLYYTWVKHLESMPPAERERGEYDRVAMEDMEAGKQGKPE